MKQKVFIAISLIILGLIIIFQACKDEELPEISGNKKIELTILKDSTSYVFAQLTCELNEIPSFAIENYGFCWDTIAQVTIEKQSNSYSNLSNQSFQKNIENLKPNKTYYVKGYIKSGDVVIYSNELTIKTLDARPVVSTNDITNILADRAQGGGIVAAYETLFPITHRGICWAKTHNPSITDSITNNGTGSGLFNCELKNLDAGVTYYVRAYAINKEGISYGEEKSFPTLDGVAELTTDSVRNITATSATFYGNIIDNDGLEILEKGFCWNTSSNPTITNNIQNVAGNILGSLNIEITGLELNTTFYVRTYIKNQEGTFYGNELSFATEDGLPKGLTTTAITNITATTAISGGNVTNDGGFDIIARGVCWSKNENPITTDSHTTDGTGTGSFTSNINGLDVNTTYYVRAYATNENGSSYSNQLSFRTKDGIPLFGAISITEISDSSAVCDLSVVADGGLDISAIGVCWNTSSNPSTTDNNETVGSSIGNYTANLDNLVSETNYHVRAFVINSQNTFYSNEISFTTLPTPTLPVITTVPVTNITAISAESGGEITGDGNSAITEKGVCWSTTDMPTINDNKIIEGTGSASFSSIVSGLSASTVYYVRAYAINSIGISYGNSISFTTTDGKPEVETLSPTNITTSSADCNGNVVNDGGFEISQNGICWSTTNTDPTLSDNVVNASTPGTGTFTIPLSSLSVGTYYFKAFATNSNGTSYGSVESFIIAGEPLLNEVTDDEVFDGRGIPLKGTGNGDGVINVGEDIDFRITIRNNGTADAYNINAILEVAWEPDNEICNISDNLCELSTLIAGNEGDVDYFDFQISGLPPDDPNNQLFFKLTLNYEDASGNQYEYIFTGNEEINKRIYP